VTSVTQNEDRIVVTQGEWIALSARLQGTGAKIKIPFYNFYKHDLQATSPWMMNTFWYSQTVWTAGYELTSLANISPQAVLPAACKDVS